MAIDTPAKIAILGAGPIGLEAALYSRFLGYDVAIYEAGDVAASVRAWGHVRMFTPFAMNCSSLGLAAIAAHDENYQPPRADELLTGSEWTERYLLPLAQTDLLADHLQLNTTVLGIGKEEVLKGELPGDEERGDWPFRILVRDARGHERIDEADAVIDATGVFRQPIGGGMGGLPAIGEQRLRDAIEYRLPDILGSEREKYVGQRVLLVGSGYSAATSAVALARLAAEAPDTRITWIVRRELAADSPGPIPVIADDRLPERAALARRANELAAAGGAIELLTATTLLRVEHDSADGLAVELAGPHAGPHAGERAFDRIIANVGYRPDNRLYEELQIHECYATQGPMKLAALLGQGRGADCLDQPACGPPALLNPEPNFYVLGAKSYGRRSTFLFSIGLAQIRDLFTIIGERETLDLYAGPKSLRD
jgi:thioredoxin reductase